MQLQLIFQLQWSFFYLFGNRILFSSGLCISQIFLEGDGWPLAKLVVRLDGRHKQIFLLRVKFFFVIVGKPDTFHFRFMHQ
jgi:hypothetical protein